VERAMSNGTLGSYGIDASTGRVLPRATPADLAAVARNQPLTCDRLKELAKWRDEVAATPGKRGVIPGHDPCNLAEVGWGLVFAADDLEAEKIEQALTKLIEWRQDVAGSEQSHFFRVFSGADGYRQGETNRTFLSRHRVGPGLANPHFMPYYLLLVGTPQQIPYPFQYQLDIEYAVGRIAFDTLDEYRRYAENVVAAEEATLRPSRRAVFFGPRHTCDPATVLSSGHLVEPLAGKLAAAATEWRVDSFVGEGATKACLKSLLGAGEPPALLFTAGHGMMFRADDPRQAAAQGALVCQDWPGRAEAIQSDWYFAAADVPAGARLQGLIAFHFACFSAGTPKADDFTQACGEPDLALQPFVSRLPQRLLGQEGGALAVIGHVERAWECSIEWPDAGPWIQPFEVAFGQLLEGYPVGAAMEVFGKRYAELSSDLGSHLQGERRGEKVDSELLANLWTWSNDARNYAVFGDPAVRLTVPPPAGTR
jgi:hypothetical protein